MGKAANSLDTIWPDGADPKTLLCVRVQCSAAQLFDILFVEPDLSEQLHKQRGDTELAESGWVSSKTELPPQLYTWDACSESGKPTHTLRHRKVRFESPPAALASKPFQNEESQVVTELFPSQLYVLEAVSTTSAPYGDKFNVFFRYVVRTDGPSAATLHLLFHVEFLPSMNRMMKPMVGKAIDAGVRGTFKIFRSVLGGIRPTVDIKESELPPGPPAVHHHGHAVEEEEAEAGPVEDGGAPGDEHHGHHARHHPHHPGAAAAGYQGSIPGGVAMPGLLSVMTQQLVYKDQVVLLADLAGAGLRSVTHSDIGAQVLAALLTVWLISLAVAALRGWQALCAAVAPPGGAAGGLLFVLRLGVCWPLRLVDLPENTSEVLASLALVAGINWAVIRASQAVVRYLSEANPALLASLQNGGAAGGGGGPPVEVVGGVAFVEQESGATVGVPAGGSGGGAGLAGMAASLSSAAAPAAGANEDAVPTMARSGSTAGSAKGGHEKGKGKGGAAHLATMALGLTAALGGKSAGGSAGASPAAKSKPRRAAPAPKQFSAAQLKQLELGMVTGSASSATKKESAGSGSLPMAPVLSAPSATGPPGGTGPSASPPTGAPVAPAAASAPSSGAVKSATGVTSAVPAMAAMADAWAADLPAGMVVHSDLSRSAVQAAAASAAGAAPAAAAWTANGAVPAATTSEVSVTAKGQETGTAARAASPPPSLPISRAATAGTQLPVMSPPSAAAGTALVAPSYQSMTTAGSGAGAPSAANTFANMFTREGIDSMAESLRSAFRWDAKASDAPEHAAAGSLTSPESFASPSSQPPASNAKARSDAGALLGGGAAAAEAGAARASAARIAASASGRSLGGGAAALQHQLGTASAALSVMYSATSEMPLLQSLGEDDGESEEPSVVVEEVFENERFQPFRGWGHMWPGHFLPSDRVGHWSDRQGKPGGSASMSFDQVVPRLPRGWRWVEDEWQVDVEGLDNESVDPDGWTYALDFYLLKYPPPPQGGKCSLKHFVRRRRYFRTRVRCDDGTDSVRRSWDGGSSAPADPVSSGEGDADEQLVAAAATRGQDHLLVEGPEKVMSLAEGLHAGIPVGDASVRSGRSSAAAAAADRGDDIELRPQAPLSSSAPSRHLSLSSSPPPVVATATGASDRSGGGSSGGGAGPVDLPRPRSEGTGLSESATRHANGLPPPVSSPRNCGDSGLADPSRSAVAATLALLPGPCSSRPSETGPIEVDYSPRRGAAAADGGETDASRRSGEEFVQSPTTVITSQDPLGALVDVDSAGGRSRQPHGRGDSDSGDSVGSVPEAAKGTAIRTAQSAAATPTPPGSANGHAEGSQQDGGKAQAAGGSAPGSSSASGGPQVENGHRSPGGLPRRASGASGKEGLCWDL